MVTKIRVSDSLTFGTKLVHSSKKKVDFQLSDDKRRSILCSIWRLRQG